MATEKDPARGMWVRATKKIAELGGEASAGDIYLSDTYDYGKVGPSRALSIACSQWKLIEPTGEKKPCKELGSIFGVYRLTEKGWRFINGKMNFLLHKSNNIEGMVLTSRPGVRSAATWMAPLAEPSSLSEVSPELYVDKLIGVIAASARRLGTLKEKLAVRNSEKAELNLGEIPVLIKFEGEDHVYRFNLPELRLGLALGKTLGVNLKILPYALTFVGKPVSRDEQMAFGELGIDWAHKALLRNYQSTETEVSDFLGLYQEFFNTISEINQE